MENKQKDRALDVPEEANRDKHINYLAAEEGDSENDNSGAETGATGNKNDADSGNYTTNEILQKEKLIDPGNEHNHHEAPHNSKNERSKHDADAGGDGTGTLGSKPE